MTIREGWDIYQVCELVLFLAAIPLIAYRGWRWATNRPSRPLLAGALFATTLWIWTYCDTEFGWRILTEELRAFQVCGGTAILASASLYVFIANACSAPANVRDRAAYTTALAATVIVAAIAATVSTVSEGANYFQFLTEPHPGLPARLHAAMLFGHLYIMCVTSLIAGLGIKYADRTPAGQGLGILGVACSLLLVTLFTRYIASEIYEWQGQVPPFWCGLLIQTIFGATAAILTLIAFAWPPTILRLRALAELRILRCLHYDLTSMFPGLAPPISREDRLSDRVYEYVSQIQDGLVLIAQRRAAPLTANSHGEEPDERASRIAKWLKAEQPAEREAMPSFSAPSPMSDRRWVLTIAEHYRNEKEGQSCADCGSSGDTPSTSHKRSIIPATTLRLSADRA